MAYDKTISTFLDKLKDEDSHSTSSTERMIDIELRRNLGVLSAEGGPLSKNLIIAAINGSPWIEGNALPLYSLEGTENAVLGNKVASALKLCRDNLLKSDFTATKQDFLEAVNRLPASIVQKENP